MLATIESILRRAVHEEVQRVLLHGAASALQTSAHQKQPREHSSLCLVFAKGLSLPIFTSSRIEDSDKNPLQVSITAASGDDQEEANLIPIPSSMKLEMVVVNGDFPPDQKEDWTAEEFDRNVVRERAGKRPLLTGDVSVVMKNGVAASMEDLVITDNSSWIRSRHFRIGARVARGSCVGVRIREALTERFMVKDHRGEFYKKSYPPRLHDEVWRLERISKDGAFHRRLSAVGVNTVQDLLMQWTINPQNLRKVMDRMSDKKWETTIKHARTCVLGSKVYLYRKPGYTIIFNPISEVVCAVVNGVQISPGSLADPQKAFVEQMALEARRQWKMLEEADQTLGSAALLQSVEGASFQTIKDELQPMKDELQPMIDGLTADGEADLGGWYSCPAGPNPVSFSLKVTPVPSLSSDDDSYICHDFL